MVANEFSSCLVDTEKQADSKGRQQGREARGHFLIPW